MLLGEDQAGHVALVGAERSRVVDQDHPPVLGDQDVAEVPVLVADEVVEGAL